MKISYFDAVCIECLKEEGIRTAVDTFGYARASRCWKLWYQLECDQLDYAPLEWVSLFIEHAQ